MADWSFLNNTKVERAVTQFAKIWADKMGSEEDAFSAAVVHIAENPKILEGKTSARIIRARLAHDLKMHDYRNKNDNAPSEEAPSVAVSPPREIPETIPGAYTFEKVASLVWACWSLEDMDAMRDPFGERVEPEVKSHVYHDPSHANDLWAEIADVRKAYCVEKGHESNKVGLLPWEIADMRTRYVMDCDPVERDTPHADKAIVKITNYLNGGHVGD